jgi:hypothetical protein
MQLAHLPSNVLRFKREGNCDPGSGLHFLFSISVQLGTTVSATSELPRFTGTASRKRFSSAVTSASAPGAVPTQMKPAGIWNRSLG